MSEGIAIQEDKSHLQQSSTEINIGDEHVGEKAEDSQTKAEAEIVSPVIPSQMESEQIENASEIPNETVQQASKTTMVEGPVITEQTTTNEIKSIPAETVASLNGWTAKRVSITGQMFFEREADGSIKLDRPKEALTVTEETRRSDLQTLPLETVGALGGWTAKRVSITGQIFFERDADGVIKTERPREALDSVTQEDDSDDSDIEQEAALLERKQKAPLVVLTDAKSTASPLPSPMQADKPVPIPPDIIAQIQAMEGNNRCADCGASGPTWASVSFGVLLCMSCSGNHRSFGSHISAVKSLTLDNWTSDQIAYLMPHGGNAKFKQSVKSEGKQSARYKTEEAAMYRARLRALVKGEPVPEKLESVDLDRPGSNAGSLSPNRSGRSVQDSKEATFCQLCGRPFSVVVRKHFCRNCDRAVCSRCAPAANTKPLPHLGLGMTPMRHCAKCYRSPFIDWSSVGLSSAEQAAEAAVAAEGPTIGTLSRRKTMTRRKTMSDQKKQPERRKTLGQQLASLMKRG